MRWPFHWFLFFLLVLSNFQDVFAQDRGNSLFTAAYSGDAKQVSALLEKGASPNSANAQGVTALMIASLKGHIEIVKLLLLKNANVNAKDASGMTALMAASNLGNNEIVQMLIETKGIDINLLSNKNLSALMIAAMSGKTEIVKKLLFMKAKVDQKADNGLSALGFAKVGNHHDITKLLLDAGAQDN